MSKKLNIIIENTFTPSKEVCNESLKTTQNEYPDRSWIVKPAILIKEIEREMIDGYCVFEVVID